MFQFYIKEKFDVLRMFRLLFKYRLARKMQLHLLLFALFIYEGLDGGGGVWYSLFIKNLAHYSSH